MAKLVTENHEIIKQLLDISKEIKIIYNELDKLEVEELYTSLEYNELIRNLNVKIEEENKIFLEIGNNPERIQMIMEYLTEKSLINNFLEDLRILISGNNDEIIKRRIIIKLLTRKLNIEKERLYVMGKELDEDIESVGIETDSCKNYGYYGLSNLLLLSNAFKEDFVKTLFILLKKEKDDINKYDFYNITYTLVYFYDFIEQIFLQNYTEDKVYWSSKLTFMLKGISEEAYKNTKEIYGYELANSICNLENNEILNRILRVSLLFCDDDDIEKLKKDCPEKLIKLIKHLKSDKEIPVVLTLNLRRQS